ncbi:hypothetical protein D3C80_2046460 [compost metagenome]
MAQSTVNPVRLVSILAYEMSSSKILPPSGSPLFGKSVKQANPAANTFMEAREVVFLVGRMNAIIVLGEADEEGFNA